MTHHIFLIYLLCVGCVINTFLRHMLYEINLQYSTFELYIVLLYLHQFVVQKTYPFPGSSFTYLPRSQRDLRAGTDIVTHSRQYSGRFSKHCSNIYIGETLSIFLCFMLNARTVRRSTYMKNDTMPDIGICHAMVNVFIHQLHTSSCSVIPQAVRAIFNFMYVTCCPEHLSLIWLGCDPMSHFTYLELKSL